MRSVEKKLDKGSVKAAGLGKGFYIAVILVSVALIACAVFWINNTLKASEQTINSLGKFYLQEITERNVNNIASNIDTRAGQIKSAVEPLGSEHIRDESSIRKYISMIQKLNGYEATKKIRALDDAEKANLPIIAMTANAFEEDKREAANAGMNGHIAKPIDVDKLFKTLAEILGKRK